MTNHTNKYRTWAIAWGAAFLIFYLFLDSFFDKIWVLSFILLLLFGLVFIIVAVKGLMKKVRFMPIVIAGVILTIAAVEIAKSETFKSPIILKAALKDDLSVIYLVLRKDKTFEVNVASMFNNEKFKGAYQLNDNKLIFLNKHYSNDFIPDTMTIAQDKIYFQFDNTGKPLSNFAAYFTITHNQLKNGP
jgi:hypothetical protein